MITYTGAEHRGRVLMWYRSEEGHKNERAAAKKLFVIFENRWVGRVDGQTVEEEVLSRVSHRVCRLYRTRFLVYINRRSRSHTMSIDWFVKGPRVCLSVPYIGFGCHR